MLRKRVTVYFYFNLSAGISENCPFLSLTYGLVAEEVRNLASRSAKAAKETADLIESAIKKVEKGKLVVVFEDGAKYLQDAVDKNI